MCSQHIAACHVVLKSGLAVESWDLYSETPTRETSVNRKADRIWKSSVPSRESWLTTRCFAWCSFFFLYTYSQLACLYSSVFDVWHSLTVLDWCSEVLGEWHTTSWESCEPEKVFQAVHDSANLVITPTVGLQRRTLTCISANASVLPPRLVLITFQNTFYI